MRLAELFEIYDGLKELVPAEEARNLIADHEPRGEIIYDIEPGQLNGVLFFWQIADPHDVKLGGPFPGETPWGRYLYLPFFWVAPRCRDGRGRLFWRLVQRACERSPGVRRIAFRRRSVGDGSRDERRLHILDIPRTREPQSEALEVR